MSKYYWRPMYRDLELAKIMAERRAERHRGLHVSVFKRECQVGPRYFATSTMYGRWDGDEIVYSIEIPPDRQTVSHVKRRTRDWRFTIW